jgi:hypothetical protein
LNKSANVNFLRPFESTLTRLSGLPSSSLRPILVGVAVVGSSSLFLPAFAGNDYVEFFWLFLEPPDKGINGSLIFFFLESSSLLGF